MLIRRNIYTVIFKLNLIKSRVKSRLGLVLRVRVILLMYITGFLINQSIDQFIEKHKHHNSKLLK